MPFFIRGRGKPVTKKKNLIKRKSTGPEKSLKPSSSKRRQISDEEITSDEEEHVFKKSKSTEDEYFDETPQEKKIRLANQFLEELKKHKENEIEDDDDVRKAVGKQLREDVLEAQGRLQRLVADSYEAPDAESVKLFKCKQHKLTLTNAVVSNDEKFIFTSSKDSNIVKWSIEGQRLGVIPRVATKTCKGHSSHILSLALSTDGNFLASGDFNGDIHIWNPNSLEHLHHFQEHSGPISGLSFRKGTHILFSASHDRLVTMMNLDTWSYLEKLGGHQDSITSIDALFRESCITSGGRDEMIIVYVIADNKQLRFNASQASIDGVKLINEKTFISFGQNGSLALWTTIKKKPHFVVNAAHGRNPEFGEPYWLTSVASLINTDVIASGSSDGFVRLWKVDHGKRKLESMFAVPVAGFVNSLEFTSSGSHLIAAVGQEHKLGRWVREKSAKNSLVIIPLPKIS